MSDRIYNRHALQGNVVGIVEWGREALRNIDHADHMTQRAHGDMKLDDKTIDVVRQSLDDSRRIVRQRVAREAAREVRMALEGKE